LATSLGKTGLSTGMFNGAVFIAAFLFCLVLNLFSAGLPAWRMSRLNITDSINVPQQQHGAVRHRQSQQSAEQGQDHVLGQHLPEDGALRGPESPTYAKLGHPAAHPLLWQVLSENMVLTLLGGLLGLAMSYGAMLLLRDYVCSILKPNDCE